MFSHIVLGSNDIERSRRFYDAILCGAGSGRGRLDAKGRLVYAHAGGRLLLTRPIDGDAATPSNGATIGFLLADPGEVDAWYAAGIANGGTAIEDPPGLRHATEGRVVYLAYLRDPDGNKLCGFHKVSGRPPSPAKG